jgi:putative two-component system response regulator
MPILIVDDSMSSLSLVTQMVTTLGREVCPFSDPLKAYEYASRNHLSLVITDYDMPGMNGITLLERLRALPNHADLPVIMISANTDGAIRRKALEAGVSDFLRKPFDEAELTVRMRNLLALRASQMEAKAYTRRLEVAVRNVTGRLERREQEIILRLSRAAEHRDTDTGSHIVRMATYCRIIASQVGLSADDVQMIYGAAPMHDIGKLAISDNILHKPGPLTPEERKTMETHTLQGYDILKDSDCELLRLGAEIALNHHERWDGKGYPNKLAGNTIPMAARVAAVADVFDALTTERPYKRAWSPNEARDFITKEAGRQFDPQCVAALLSGWREILDVYELSRKAETAQATSARANVA